MRDFVRKNKQKIVYILILIFLLFFCSLFPYTGDDWAWGSSIGIERVESFFENYNGRYAGNLIVLVLTRFVLLRVVVMAASIFGIIYLSYKLTNKNKFSLFLLATLLVLALPKLILRQAIVWTSGFTNYVIPTVLVFIYFHIIDKDVVNKKVETLLNICLFILGFITALFVEHITIYIIVITLFMMIYQKIKEKKISSKYLFYLIGAIIGAVLMFSNGAYGNIADNQDSYRNIPTSGVSSIIEKVSENFATVYKELILNNTLLNLVLGTLILVTVYQFFKKEKKELKFVQKAILSCLVFTVVGYLIYMLIKVINPTWNIALKYTNYFEFLISVIFFLSIIMITFICVDKKEVKQKIIFYWLSIGILTIPLFVVQPIGSRCFFTSYCLFILIILELYDYCIAKESELLKKVIIFAIIIYAIYLTSIYGYIFKVNQDRIQYLTEKNAEGEKIIEVVNLPYEDYLWTSRPTVGSIWEDRFKLFYNISADVKIKNVTLKEWDKIVK